MRSGRTRGSARSRVCALATLALVLAAPLSAVPQTHATTGRDGPRSLARGLDLFDTNCAVCHGALGRGDGPAAALLHPSPRDFASARFKLVSTANSLPHDEDLLRTIRLGMPGSAMPAWGHLPERDLHDLVEAVRHILIEAKIAQMIETPGTSRAKAVEEAMEILDPGERVDPGPEARWTPESLARGRFIYNSSCASCHDKDGRGRVRRDMKDNLDMPIAPRDFSRGIFKGGASGRELALRVMLGMPGTPMPAMRLSPDDVWAVVHYVQTLITPGAERRIQQRRQTLVARRVEDRLDEHMHLDDWDRAPRTFVPLMPMVWSDERVEGVEFRALHDGKRLALQLTWSDYSNDQEEDADDAVAVQITRALDPPFFGMGTGADPVAILEWRAAWQAREPGAWSVFPVLAPPIPDASPDAGPRRADGTPVGHGGARKDWPVRELRSTGPGHLHEPAVRALDVRGRGVRTPEGWNVVLFQDLERGLGEVSLEAGSVASIAFAVWNGAAGDAKGRKSVTIWQHLLLKE